MVKVWLVVFVGVPEITPVAALRVNPEGSAPGLMENTSAPLPPLAAMVCV
jgi:hypothetical protein